jgi:cytochrome P450/CRP-like cAMP-binding protein
MSFNRRAASSAAPPMVRGLPVLGNTLDALRDVCGLLAQAYHTHGPIFRLSRLGREATVLAGIEANEFFLQNEDALFYSRDIYHYLSSEASTDHSFIALDGPPHRRLRDQMRLGYSRQLVAGAVPSLVEYVRTQARAWQTEQTLDVLELMSNLLMEQAGTSLLNCSLTPHDFRPLNTFSKTFVGVGVDIQPPILLRRPGYQRAKRHFFALMDAVFAEHDAHPPGDDRQLDQIDIARNVRYADGAPLSDHDAKGCTYFSYVKNSVYTNRMGANLLYALLKDPALMARVLAEVDAACDAGPVNMAALRRMPVLRAAMHETLRLYPIVAGLPRHAKQDFEFGGYTIRKGQKVYIAASVTHMLPEFFPNPYAFDADRFLPPREEHRQPRVFLPFGAGAHACLGASLATLYTMTTIVGLLREAQFQIEPPTYLARRVADPLPGPNGFRVRARARLPAPATPGSATAIGVPQASEDEDLALLDAPQLDRAQQDKLVASAERRVYQPGEIIIQQGDETDAFYMLVRGMVEVYIKQPGQIPQLLAEMTDGAFFGEIGLLQGIRRTATVRASEATVVEVLVIDRDSFLSYVAEFDLIGDEIAALVRRRTNSRNLAKALPTLSHEQIAQVSPEIATQTYAPGEVIIRQGDPAETFYILTSGRAEVIRRYPSGSETTIGWCEPGEYFGEIGLLHDRPRTATVRAAEAGAEVLVLGRAAFLSLMGGSSATESAIAREMAQRLIAIAH